MEFQNYAWYDEILENGAVHHAFQSLGVGHHDQVTLVSAWMICIGLILFALLGRMALNAARARGGTLQYVPDPSLSFRTGWELAISGLNTLVQDILPGKDGRTFFALLATLFIYILTSNLSGLVPGFHAPTGSIHNNFAMALVVLIVFNGAGLMRNGVGYLKHLLGPVWWLAPLILLIELISLLVVRPYSLSLRLMGNMFGDHMVFGIMSDLTKFVFSWAFLGLGAFVSVIQALVFTLLSGIYIALAVEHEEGH